MNSVKLIAALAAFATFASAGAHAADAPAAPAADAVATRAATAVAGTAAQTSAQRASHEDAGPDTRSPCAGKGGARTRAEVHAEAVEAAKHHQSTLRTQLDEYRN
jgi:hypothetical protein